MKTQFHFKKCWFIISIFFIWQMSFAQPPILDEMKQELDREFKHLGQLEKPPYFISHHAGYENVFTLTTSFGSLVNQNQAKLGMLNTSVRIGDYQFDNTHPVPNDYGFFGFSGGIAIIPIDLNPIAFKVNMWRNAEQQYKSALRQYNMVLNKKDEDLLDDLDVADFARGPVATYSDDPFGEEEYAFDTTVWVNRLKEYSSFFNNDKSIVAGTANLSLDENETYFVSTEGSAIYQQKMLYKLMIQGEIIADDGNILTAYRSYLAPHIDSLPLHETILKDCGELLNELFALRAAPLADPYSGPAILGPEVAAVFFHEIFGHRIEGHRIKKNYDGQTFKDKVNTQVLPKDFDLYFDPTIDNYQGMFLSGHYIYDDEGIRSQKVNVIEKGKLNSFLMSRCPIQNFPSSNGHGRGSIMANPVARQSNMIVSTSKPKSEEQLRNMLIKECRKQGKNYGYYFKQVTGGFTSTSVYSPNVFNIMPTIVYKVYTDGRPDELVRGVNLIGTPLIIFSEIRAGGDHPGVFNGVCGAESGGVPVAAVSPALFVRKIETQREIDVNERTPILDMPTRENQTIK